MICCVHCRYLHSLCFSASFVLSVPGCGRTGTGRSFRRFCRGISSSRAVMRAVAALMSRRLLVERQSSASWRSSLTSLSSTHSCQSHSTSGSSRYCQHVWKGCGLWPRRVATVKVKRYCKPGRNSMTQLRSVTRHMGSHSVTFHPTQANTPRLYPSPTGWYSIYRPFKGGELSKPRPRVQRATGPRLLRDSPEPARTEPMT